MIKKRKKQQRRETYFHLLQFYRTLLAQNSTTRGRTIFPFIIEDSLSTKNLQLTARAKRIITHKVATCGVEGRT